MASLNKAPTKPRRAHQAVSEVVDEDLGMAEDVACYSVLCALDHESDEPMSHQVGSMLAHQRQVGRHKPPLIIG